MRRDLAERYRRVLGRAATHAGPLTRVLDVGCGIGNFLELASGDGLQATGVDVEPRAIAAARARGLDAHLSAELDGALPDGSVDALTLWDVIEHVADPLALVAGLVPKLRPGGVVIVETPDAEFPARALVRLIDSATFGRVKWAELLYYLEHKTYFTARGLELLFRRAGLVPLETLHENSPRAKTARLLAWTAGTGSRAAGLLGPAWPYLDRLTRRVGRTNKLIALAVRPG